eukprot:m.100518 g.100518  ORF g.100518 m.100518 type:complete len:78 (-) comp15130_c0_seq1:1478-1711(-)
MNFQDGGMLVLMISYVVLISIHLSSSIDNTAATVLAVGVILGIIMAFMVTIDKRRPFLKSNQLSLFQQACLTTASST